MPIWCMSSNINTTPRRYKMEDYPKNSVESEQEWFCGTCGVRSTSPTACSAKKYALGIFCSPACADEADSQAIKIKAFSHNNADLMKREEEPELTYAEVQEAKLASTTFQKLDAAKNRLELIQPEFIEGLGRILSYGADKYEANNWKLMKPEDVERVKGATLRHLMSYLKGDKLDPETNESHLYHIECNLMFLDYFDRNPHE